MTSIGRSVAHRVSRLLLIALFLFCSSIGLWGQWCPGCIGNIYYNNGSVGIGTPTPAWTLDVKTTSANVVMRLSGGATSTSNNSQLRFAGTKDGELWAGRTLPPTMAGRTFTSSTSAAARQ